MPSPGFPADTRPDPKTKLKSRKQKAEIAQSKTEMLKGEASGQRPDGGRLGLAKLAAEVGDARGDGGQTWQAFQNGFIPQRLKFFAQFVGDISKARFQEFQGCRAQRFPLAFDSTFDPAFDPASSFNVGDVFHTLCVFVLRMFKVKFAFQFAW